MLLLRRPLGKGLGVEGVAIFGMGLLGSAIARACRRGGPWEESHVAMPWMRPGEQPAALARLGEELTRDAVPGPRALHIIWCAGSVGFGASEVETEAELGSFRNVLGFAERLAGACGEVPVVFHLVSSAGGLYEGQRHVGPGSRPRPLRPYGRLKQNEEELLGASPARLVKRIYRLSSVYGPVRGRHRRGLIPALILNGLQHRVSTIVGKVTTLRDYVYVDDVAEFIVGALPAHEDATLILAAGQAASIQEVKHLVEGVLKRPLNVRYTLTPVNGEDITFSRRALPAGWRPSEVQVNVRRLYADAIMQGLGDG